MEGSRGRGPALACVSGYIFVSPHRRSSRPDCPCWPMAPVRRRKVLTLFRERPSAQVNRTCIRSTGGERLVKRRDLVLPLASD